MEIKKDNVSGTDLIHTMITPLYLSPTNVSKCIFTINVTHWGSFMSSFKLLKTPPMQPAFPSRGLSPLYEMGDKDFY